MTRKKYLERLRREINWTLQGYPIYGAWDFRDHPFEDNKLVEYFSAWDVDDPQFEHFWQFRAYWENPIPVSIQV